MDRWFGQSVGHPSGCSREKDQFGMPQTTQSDLGDGKMILRNKIVSVLMVMTKSLYTLGLLFTSRQAMDPRNIATQLERHNSKTILLHRLFLNLGVDVIGELADEATAQCRVKLPLPLSHPHSR